MKLNRVDKDKTYREKRRKRMSKRIDLESKKRRWAQRVFNGDENSRKEASNKLRTHFQRRAYLKWKAGKENKQRKQAKNGDSKK